MVEHNYFLTQSIQIKPKKAFCTVQPTAM